jgi:hypothetical protein
MSLLGAERRGIKPGFRLNGAVRAVFFDAAHHQAFEIGSLDK